MQRIRTGTKETGYAKDVAFSFALRWRRTKRQIADLVTQTGMDQEVHENFFDAGASNTKTTSRLSRGHRDGRETRDERIECDSVEVVQRYWCDRVAARLSNNSTYERDVPNHQLKRFDTSFDPPELTPGKKRLLRPNDTSTSCLLTWFLLVHYGNLGHTLSPSGDPHAPSLFA